jgi:hypothetical protein
MNYTYPKSRIANNGYIPHKINESKIADLEIQISKLTKAIKQTVVQTEYYYRDLVKVESFDLYDQYNQKNEFYFKKKQTALFDLKTNELTIKYETKEIKSHNFPNLHTYDYDEQKTIYKFNNVLLIKNRSFWTICVQYDKKTNEITNIITELNKII